MVSQGSGSSPMSLRRPSQNNNPTLFGWSQGHKGSSLYSSKRSLLPDHLMDAREVTNQVKTGPLACGAHTKARNSDDVNTTPHPPKIERENKTCSYLGRLLLNKRSLYLHGTDLVE